MTLRSYFRFLLGLILLATPISAMASSPVAIKLLVEQDRMYQVTGADLARALDMVNTYPLDEITAGPDLLTGGGAYRDAGLETPDIGGTTRIWGSPRFASVESATEPGVAGVGAYCLRALDTSGQMAALRINDPGLHISGGKRYRLTWRIFHNGPETSFRISLMSTGTGSTTAINPVTSTVEHVAKPGVWNQFVSEARLPDAGLFDYAIKLQTKVEPGKQGAPFYVDGLMVQQLAITRVDKPFRDKTPEEQAFTINQIHTGGLNLTCQGALVPIWIENPTPEGMLAPETTITFWGDFPRGTVTRGNSFTRRNAYMLHLASVDPPCRYSPPQPMGNIAPDAPVLERAPKTARIERDSLLQYFQYFEGGETDRLMWTEFLAPPRVNPLTLDLGPLPDLPAGTHPTELRLLLWGKSDTPLDPDHMWKIGLNGVDLGLASWNGRNPYLFTASAPAINMTPEGPNQLTFLSTLQGTEVDVISFDWAEATYEASLLPIQDALEFALPAVSTQFRTSSGLTGAETRLFLEGSPEVWAPLAADGAVSGALPPREGNVRARIVGPSGYVKPERLDARPDPYIRQLTVSPEYVIITHRLFLDAMAPLLAHRAAQGLTVAALDVESIYDEYAGGMFAPEAIRACITDLLAKPGLDGKHLQYVFLVGDATYDYMNIQSNAPNYVPTHQATDGVFQPEMAPTYAEDGHFVYGSGDGFVPLAAVGRVPCGDAQTARDYVAKVIEYEQAVDDAPWKHRAALLCSNEFKAQPEELAGGLLKGMECGKFYGGETIEACKETQRQFLDFVSQGCALIHFSGHGGEYVWRMGEDAGKMALFSKDDLSGLRNAGMYPIMLSSTCYSTIFDEAPRPYRIVDSGIGVYAVLAPRSGAIAIVGHGGKQTSTSGHGFNRDFLTALITGGSKRLGDAFLAAKKLGTGSALDRGMTLIGDPALHVSQIQGFKAPPSQARNRLVWRTETETNAFGFYVYRADTAIAPMICLNPDAPLHAAGNSSTPRQYIYYDLAVTEGTAYHYKLEQVDLDGTRRWIVGDPVPVAGAAKPLTDEEAAEIKVNGAVYGRNVGE